MNLAGANQLISVANDKSLKDLYSWYKMTLRKVGKIILANRKGHTDKVRLYLQNLERLRITLLDKANLVNDADTSNDLRIMAANIALLQSELVRIITLESLPVVQVPVQAPLPVPAALPVNITMRPTLTRPSPPRMYTNLGGVMNTYTPQSYNNRL